MRLPRAAWVLLAAAAAYLSAILWKTSFLVGPVRFFALADDAMISMRYARHLVEGRGLVWNPGEPPIEGFTNPLWMLVMSAVHLLPLPPHRMTLAVQGIGLGILLGLLVVIHGLAEGLSPPRGERGPTPAPAPPPGRRPRANPGRRRAADPPDGALARRDAVPLVAMALVAFYWPLHYWTLEGMEVGLLALLTAAAAGRLLSGRGPGRAYLLLGLGVLVRMDFVVIAAALAACGAGLDPARRARHAAWGAGVAFGVPAALTAARLLYFHDLLPNTYYLKLTGYPVVLRVIRGAWVLLQSVARSSGLLALAPIGVLVLARSAPTGTARRLGLLLVPFAAQCAYSVWVGGDAWEDAISCNRYVAVAMPLLLAATAWGITALGTRLDPGARLGPLPVAGLTVAAILAFAPWRDTLLLRPIPYARENVNLVEIALAARDLTRPGASVAAAAIGTIGYYSERRIVDLLGKCDRHIARLPMHRARDQNPLTYFFPGHLKWDYGYSIGTLRPDVVAQLWEYRAEAAPFLRDYVPLRVAVGEARVSLAARRGSDLVLWPPAASR